jgi:hypothetical protein
MFERFESGEFFRAAVERARECVGDALRARGVDRDIALRGERHVDEHFERDPEVREAGVDTLAVGCFARCVGTVAIEHAHALAVAFEIALHLVRASVGELVRERRRIARSGPGPIAVFLSAREAVERCEKRGAESRFAGFVRTVDHVEVRIEIERPVRKFPEALDTEAL